MGGKSQKMRVAEYRLSTHFGVCLAPVRLRGLFFGEKLAWEGDLDTQTIIGINNIDLFGGVQKEGGIQGDIYFLPGDENQTMPEGLAAKLGLTTATCPGFRGFASVFMVGNGTGVQNPEGLPHPRFGLPPVAGSAGQNLPGFVWGYNNPYLKTAWVKVTGEPEYTTGVLPDETAMIGDDCNPAHMIYDVLVDPNLMGGSAAGIHVASFIAAAQTLFDEEFGLSMGWFQQDTPEAFVSEILDHIQATVYTDPADGLFHIKLLRDDYDPDTIPEFDESNCKLTNFQRKSWGETINEIVVSFTNPANEDKATVSWQDLGNVISQGSVVTDNRDYYGVRNPDLATKLAVRDSRTASAPLASCELEIFRTTNSQIVPGGVIKVSNAALGLFGVIFRIGSVDYGRTTDSKIRLSLLEDIFGFRVGAYYAPPATLHEDGATPSEAAYIKTFTMPAFFVAQFSGGFPDPDETFAAIIATQSDGDTSRYELWSEQTTLGGSLEYGSLGERMLTGRSTLINDLDAEADTLIEFATTTPGTGPETDGFVLIGGDEDEQELAFLREIDSNNVWTLDRGMLDTTPKAWPAGTEIWFLSPAVQFGDATALADGQTVNYKVLPKTSLGTLALADATAQPVTVSNRPNDPIRPAKVRANGFGFGEIDLVSVAEADGDITITWANRNRDMEETTVYSWDDDGITPPVGVTTTIRIYSAGGTLIATHAGLTGESYVLDPYDYAGKTLVRVNVKAVDGDGNESIQGHDLLIRVGYGGWGLNWGFSWGGGS